MSGEQWWSATAPLLSRVFDQDKYPTAARVGARAIGGSRGYEHLSLRLSS